MDKIVKSDANTAAGHQYGWIVLSRGGVKDTEVFSLSALDHVS